MKNMIEFRLLVRRILPDGTIALVRPFHISLEGLETAVICKDEEDYRMMVNNIVISAIKANVIIIIYCVVSNHAHIAIVRLFISK